ncbi:MAG: matrixin family metalloprotease [Candidatus Pacearchaeota archaeon]
MKLITYFFVLISLTLVLSIVLYKIAFEIKDLKPEKMNITYIDIRNITSYNSEDLQFYPNMRFNHNLITFKIDSACDISKTEKIMLAMNRIENETQKLIVFQKIEEEPDIFISCNETEETKKRFVPTYFIAGEGGVESAVETGLFHVIEKGKVLLYYKDVKSCMNYNIELHELLHVFGFKHSDNEKSIMYSVSECGQVLTQDIISKLNSLYSIEPLPDLAFFDLSVSRQGIYLNFEAEIKNQGLLQADNIFLKIISDIDSKQKTIQTFDIGTIDYGEGKTLTVENLRLPLTFRDIKSINFVIDYPRQEISKENNKIAFSFIN